MNVRLVTGPSGSGRCRASAMLGRNPTPGITGDHDAWSSANQLQPLSSRPRHGQIGLREAGGCLQQRGAEFSHIAGGESEAIANLRLPSQGGLFTSSMGQPHYQRGCAAPASLAGCVSWAINFELAMLELGDQPKSSLTATDTLNVIKRVAKLLKLRVPDRACEMRAQHDILQFEKWAF
jgi:hypothetical protein